MVKKIVKYIFIQLKDAFTKAYIICLVIAFLLWALIKFSVVYQDNIKVDVELKNIPENWMVLGAQKQQLNCEVKTTGFRLLLLSILPDIDVKLNFEDLNLNSDTNYVFDIRYDNQDKLPDWLIKSESFNFENPKVEFQLSILKLKKVLVRPNVELKFKTGYLLDKLLLEKDSVEVLIPRKDFEKENDITTNKKTITNISQNEKIQLSLKLPKYWKLINGSKDIEAEIQVDQYTQGNFEMILEKDTIQNIQYFPSRVNLLYSVPSKRFNSINKQDFVLDIEKLSESDNNTEALKVFILKQPKLVKILAIQPSEVEFLIFDNE